MLTSALAEFDAYLQRKGMAAAALVGLAADAGGRLFADMPLRPSNWKNYVAILETGAGCNES